MGGFTLPYFDFGNFGSFSALFGFFLRCGLARRRNPPVVLR
jgi:hypothetical protein